MIDKDLVEENELALVQHYVETTARFYQRCYAHSSA